MGEGCRVRHDGEVQGHEAKVERKTVTAEFEAAS